jgi:hypothetical protein
LRGAEMIRRANFERLTSPWPTASQGNGYLVSLASALEHPIGAIADREKRKACRCERAGGIVIAIAVPIASGRWR